MTTDLDELLCKKYPEIFRDRHVPMNQTLMCWGFACGDGWFALIDTLCASLMHDVNVARRDVKDRRDTRARIDKGEITPESSTYELMADYASDDAIVNAILVMEQKEAEIPVAMQVKEKFGGLQFYVIGGTDVHHAMIDFAESMSYRICEECGTTNTARCWTDGWHRTLCVPCAKAAGRNIE